MSETEQIDRTDDPRAYTADLLEEIRLAFDSDDKENRPHDVRLWNGRASAGWRFCRPFHAEAMELMSYYAGHQWLNPVTTHSLASESFRLKELEEGPDWDVRVTINKIRQHIDIYASSLLYEQPMPVVTPATEDDDSWYSASVGNQFLRYYDKMWKSDSKNVRFASIFVLTGLGAYLVSYDPSAIAETVDDKGIPVFKPVGNVICDMVPPWDFCWEPKKMVRESDWYVRRSTMKIRDIIATWSERGAFVSGEEGVSDDGDSEGTLGDAMLSGLFDGDYGSDGEEDDLDDPLSRKATVQQGYARKQGSSEFSESWTVFSWSGGIFLGEETVEWEPLIPSPFNEITGYWFPLGLGKMLKGLQDRLNRLESTFQKNINANAEPKLIFPPGCELKSADGDDYVFSNEPGEHVHQVAGNEKPYYMETPLLSSDAHMDLERVERWIEDLSMTHEVSKGGTPAGVKSGKAIGLLQMQDQAPKGLVRTNLLDGFRRRYRAILSAARSRYDEPHFIGVAGDDERSDILSFDKSHLKRVRDVTLDVGSTMPLSPSEHNNLIYTLYKDGMYQEGREKEREALLRDLKMGTPKRTRTLEDEVRKLAHREHVLLEREFQMPNPDENELAEVMLEAHLLYKYSSGYTRLEDAQKQILDVHIFITRALIVNQRAGIRSGEMYVEGGGQAAPGPEMGGMGMEAGMVPGGAPAVAP